MDCPIVIEKIKSSIAMIFVVKENEIISKGSGFVFFKKGILVTCNHVVVNGDANILIKFFDNEEPIESKIIIRDEEHDIALLKFNDMSREPLKQEELEVIKEGIPVIFAGYPLSLESLTTHQGILSAIIKDATGFTNYMIDGTVNAGNSGCPLMSENGKVIGIVNAKRRERSDLLRKIEKQETGAISLHGIDLVETLQAVISNVQLGIGYAIPCGYIPQPSKDVEVQKKVKRS